MESSYKKFLESEYYYRKLSLYEKICSFFDVNFRLPKELEEKYENEINFCHLKVSPQGVFLTSIILPLIIFTSLFSVFYFLNFISTAMILMLVLLSAVAFYYLFSYTSFLTKYFRAKAAAEMTLGVVYMSISLKINSNLESAVAFAASNLTGPLGMDLKKILWDLETGGLLSVITGLDWLSEKWKSESEEFVDSITLLKASINEPPDRMEKSIREAVMIMADGTKTRMKKYALGMRSPLKILNAFGILLPMMGLIFFPVLVIFVPEISRPELLAFSYMFLLPAVVYLFLREYFYTKPYSYHQVEMKSLKGFKWQKIIALLISFVIAIVPTSYLLYSLSIIPEETIFSFEQFIYSFLIIASLSSSIIFYSVASSFGNLKKNKEILRIESELPVALFQLSITSDIGKPIERNIEDLMPRIGTLKIKSMFERMLYNIKTLGMTLESAIFEKKVGAIYSYPSKVISSSFRLLVDVSKRGMASLSMALKTISEFLKDADDVNNATTEILSETTSDMQVQAWVFAPLSAGVVVGLMAIVIYIFSFFGGNFQEMEKIVGSGEFGDATMSSISFLFNIGKQVPFHNFQIIVGVYMIEMVFIISYFLGELNYGNDEVSKTFDLGKIMLVAIAVYSMVVLSIYFGITSFIQMPEIGL
jgi:positive regulator of sigma E activity